MVDEKKAKDVGKLFIPESEASKFDVSDPRLVVVPSTVTPQQAVQFGVQKSEAIRAGEDVSPTTPRIPGIPGGTAREGTVAIKARLEEARRRSEALAKIEAARLKAEAEARFRRAEAKAEQDRVRQQKNIRQFVARENVVRPQDLQQFARTEGIAKKDITKGVRIALEKRIRGQRLTTSESASLQFAQKKTFRRGAGTLGAGLSQVREFQKLKQFPKEQREKALAEIAKEQQALKDKPLGIGLESLRERKPFAGRKETRTDLSPNVDLSVITQPSIVQIRTGKTIRDPETLRDIPIDKFLFVDPTVIGKQFERQATDKEIADFKKQTRVLESTKKVGIVSSIKTKVIKESERLGIKLRKGTEQIKGGAESVDIILRKKITNPTFSFIEETAKKLPVGKIEKVRSLLDSPLDKLPGGRVSSEFLSGAAIDIIRDVREKPLKQVVLLGLGAGISVGTKAVVGVGKGIGGVVAGIKGSKIGGKIASVGLGTAGAIITAPLIVETVVKTATATTPRQAGGAFGVAAKDFALVGVGASATTRGLNKLSEPLITKIKVEPKRTVKDITRPIPGTQITEGRFSLVTDTPSQLAIVDTRIKKFKRSLFEDLALDNLPVVSRVAKKIVERSQPSLVKLRGPETRITLGAVKTKGGIIQEGEAVSRRVGKKVSLTKISELTGGTTEFPIQNLNKLSPLEIDLIKKSLAKESKGLFVPTKDTQFFIGQVQSRDVLKITQQRVKGGKQFKIIRPKPGKTITRSQTITSAREVKDLGIEGVDLFRTRVGIRDVGRPSPRKSGKVDIIEGLTIAQEPKEIPFDLDSSLIKGEKGLISKKVLKKEKALLKSLQAQSQVQQTKATKSATGSAVTRLKNRFKAENKLQNELVRIGSLPLIVGGGGRGDSRFRGGVDVSVQEVSPQRLIPKTDSKSLTSLKFSNRFIQKTPQALFSVPKEIAVQKEITKVTQKVSARTLQKVLEKSVVKQIDKTIQKQIQKQQQKQIQKQIQKQLQKQIPKSILSPVPIKIRIKPPPTPPFLFKLPKRKRVTRFKTPSFLVELRRRGTFTTVATGLPKGRALFVGSKAVLGGLGATFRLRREDKGTNVADTNFSLSGLIFRKPKKKSKLDQPLTFIQRVGGKKGGIKTGRLTTAAERLEIKEARKRRKKK